METTEFVGRVDALERMDRFLDWDRAPGASALVVHGPRGVGRSTLLAQRRVRSVHRDFLLLPFARAGSPPGQLATRLLRTALEQLTEESLDPDLPVGRWLDVLPAAVRARVGAEAGELRPGAHPARALRCLVKVLAGLAESLGRRLVIAMDDPDCFGDAQGYPGVPKRGFPLHKFVTATPWVRWLLAPRYPGTLEAIEGRPGFEVLGLPPLGRAESYHLAALLLEREYRPVPRALLGPMHGLCDGRPGYLRAVASRLVDEAREARKVPGPEDVREAFLHEALGPMGRIGLACEARLGETARGTLGRAVMDVLAARGPLGLEAVSQLTGIGRARALDHLSDLTRRGLLHEEEGRYVVEDRVLAFRLRALHSAGGASADAAARQLGLLEELEATDRYEWERRVRGLLHSLAGRALPGGPFGLARPVCTPSHPVEEAAVGFDAQGEVDGLPGVVATDLLLNGRDRRWLIEMPRRSEPLGRAQLERSLRLLAFFARTYRRPIERLWIAAEHGFTPEARELAAAEGILLTDPSGLCELEQRTLAAVA